MKKRTLLQLCTIIFVCGGLWLVTLTPRYAAETAHASPSAAAEAAEPEPPAQPKQTPFPDFGFLPPPDEYKGEVFKLSQNYPLVRPPNSERPEFLKMDFKADWKAYMLAGRDYCFEGNVETDWRVEKNKVRRWYHMPWQHYGPSGREGIHGLTKEAPVGKQQLAVSQDYGNAVTWAVGFFNELGAWTIGRVWRNHMAPDLKWSTRPHGFPVGTVICKPLLVSIPPDIVAQQVPSLVNPMQWDAYITTNWKSSDRAIGKVTLIQMDIAVRTDDPQAPTGWLFGTFQYNGQLNKANKWENLVPLGLMWGNDPDITVDQSNPVPAKTIINPALKQTVINPDTNELPPTHLGWNGRLNGPVDNPRSSCMSCHMTAENPQLSAIAPFFQDPNIKPGSPQWMRWFGNGAWGTPFDPGTLSSDFSLQLSMSVQLFETWRDTQDGLFSTAYSQSEAEEADTGRKQLKIQGARMTSKRRQKVFTVVRDKPEQ